MLMLQRLILSFAVVVAIGAAQGLLTLSSLSKLAERLNFVATKPIAGVDNARAAWLAYRDAERHLASVLEITRIQDAKPALAVFDALVKTLDEHLARLADATTSALALDKLKAIQSDVTQWGQKGRVLLGASAATSITAPHTPARIVALIRTNLEEIVSLALTDAATISTEVQGSIRTAAGLSILLIAAGIIGGLGLRGRHAVDPQEHAVDRWLGRGSRRLGRGAADRDQGDIAQHSSCLEWRRTSLRRSADAARILHQGGCRLERYQRQDRCARRQCAEAQVGNRPVLARRIGRLMVPSLAPAALGASSGQIRARRSRCGMLAHQRVTNVR
jgi:hypothetical protein